MSSTHPSVGKFAAQALVKSIAKSHGHLGEAFYEGLDPDKRRELQEAMLAKDEMIGSSVMLLARELYSEDVRFIFELLQNADDNHYSKTSALPYVAFQLHRKRFIIECNEDGFDEANLRAICSIGNSSKVHGHGYIGEKGIGFKSVFKVAWQVHIQSGNFSFTFTHRRGDSGMGMISPEWKECSDQDTRQLTRITLELFDDNEAASRHEAIKKQLMDLQSNMLLFLKKLQRIDVHIYDDLGRESSKTIMTAETHKSTNRATLRMQETSNGTTHQEETYCHVTRHLATGLARSSHRTYTAAEEEAKSYSKAEIILAFPVSEYSVPIVEAQRIFAFLPMRLLGFNFLIQTDFVTTANREDIETSSPRNLALIDGIAEAFIKAIHQMYDHEKLRYQWMRYLANMKSYPWDTFWKRLVDKIEHRILAAEILEPRRRGSPRCIRSLKRLLSLHCNDGTPLLDDLPASSEMYLSTAYLQKDLEILRDYGLTYMNEEDFIRRLKHDLSRSDSRMKAAATSADWHRRAANAINFSFDQKSSKVIAQIRTLSLLPLKDGTWVSSAAHRAFFPKIENRIMVPDDLGLDILEEAASDSSARAKLFTNLGATVASVAHVRSQIFQKYASYAGLFTPTTPPTLDTCYSHHVFLYHTQDSNTLDLDFLRFSRSVKIHDTYLRFLKPSGHDYYFPSDDPYGLWTLSERGRGPWFRSHICFINTKFIQAPPEASSNMAWRDYLSLLGVRDQPRLVSRDGTALSELCLHVAEAFPSEFMEFLRCSWKSQESSLLSAEGIIKALKSLKVLCQGGELQPLSETYLPSPALLETASSFASWDFFPFLSLDDSDLTDDEWLRWSFLTKHLGVGVHDDLRFYVDLVKWIKSACEGEQTDNPARILDIYVRIQSRCAEARDSSAARDFVRSHMKGLIYLPQYDDEEGVWTDAVSCLLGAPRDLLIKYPIDARYRAAFPGRDLNTLAHFLGNTLGISQCSWEILVHDLGMMQECDVSDFDRIRPRYEYLDQLRRQWTCVDMNTDIMRDFFEAGSLIFIQNEQGRYRWVKPSECIWSSATEIRHKTSLSDHYDDDLEDFFVTTLGVSRLTFDMVYDELLDVDPTTVDIRQVKDYLWSMNAFLQQEETARSARTLLSKRILPVRHLSGTVLLVSDSTDFAINDREPYKKKFCDKIKLLDFTLGEVHDLMPLLNWMKLTNRFLSIVVKETTMVDQDQARPVTDPWRHIRQRAHALTRVAMHIKSPRTRDADLAKNLYELLLKAELWETDKISSILAMNQDGTAVQVEVAQSEVHITPSEKPLKIFVPCNEVLQEACFGSALPRQLIRWMSTGPITQQVVGRTDHSAIGVVTSILGARLVRSMNHMLEAQGIVDIDIPNVALEEENQTATVAVRVDPAQYRQQDTFVLPERQRWMYTPSDTAYESDSNGDAGEVGGQHVLRQGSLRNYQPHQPGIAHVEPAIQWRGRYSTLLEHVVSTARVTALPGVGASSRTTDNNRHLLSLPSGSEWLLHECGTPFERDCKIGAAGELFVFELLKSLLGDIGYECWQSTMRRFVSGPSGHPDYTDMGPWNSQGALETSDIVYEDTEGAFTALLVATQYQNVAHLAGRRGLKYYIEVKSTFGECDGAFYVSDRQRTLMSGLMTEQSVYMIIRVHNMTSGSIGAKVYVDPVKMERDGQLKFWTEKWNVTPGDVATA